jgi:Subtilase family
MSFCLYPRGQSTLGELKAALKRAKKADVVLICSTHDEGNKALEALPAQHPDTIAIACCDENNKLIQEGSTYDPQYLVRGTGFSTDAISYIDSESSIRGSSVATAIAAGIASLTLACHHFTVGKVEERTSIVKAAFDRMAMPSPDRQDLKSVQPHTLFPQRVMEMEDGKEWIREHFKEF